MTAPRQILPGTCYLISRRCSQRQFLLRPSKQTNEIFGYLLAVAAERFGVAIHAFCVMSNHFHLVLTDQRARLPDFSQFLDSLVARAMNATLGRSESFWAPASYSAVALERDGDVIDKVAYVLANPVAAGLVRHGRKWPGLWSAPQHIGRGPLVFTRPGRFFRSAGARSMPDRAVLELAAPAGFGSAEEFRGAVLRALEEREDMASSRLAEAGLGFVGAKRAARLQSVAPASRADARGGIRPRVACRDRWARIGALARLRDFLRSYRRALLLWRAGFIEVVFPAGTYRMRVTYRAACEPVG
jgi:putative transposase